MSYLFTLMLIPVLVHELYFLFNPASGYSCL